MAIYEKILKISEGSFGNVFKGKCPVTGKFVAIKEFIILDQDWAGIDYPTLREISLLRECSHPNIIKLINVQSNSAYISMVLEYVEDTLFKRIYGTPNPLKLEDIKNLFHQMTSAIYYCHQIRIIHRDVKPENVLITPDNVVKFADFGLSRTAHLTLHTYYPEVQTCWYRAIEVFLDGRLHSYAVDVWSLGCVFAEMYLKTSLFKGENANGTLLSIFETLTTPTEETWPGVSQLYNYKVDFPIWTKNILKETVPNMNGDAFDLLKKMLIFDPNKRILARDILQHDYFNSSD